MKEKWIETGLIKQIEWALMNWNITRWLSDDSVCYHAEVELPVASDEDDTSRLWSSGISVEPRRSVPHCDIA